MRTFRPEAVPAPPIDRDLVANFLTTSSQLDLEIGAGVGWHALTRAQDNPDRRLIAIERTAEKFEKFRRRYENHARPANLLPLHADAVSVVAHALPQGRFENIFVLYPNPEPKNPARRWVRMPFFETLLRLLTPTGRLIFATNEKFYADEIITVAPRTWSLDLASQKQLGPEHLAQARTHFEKKYLERGQPCFELVLIRR